MKSEFQLALEETINRQLKKNTELVKTFASEEAGIILSKGDVVNHAKMLNGRWEGFTFIESPSDFIQSCAEKGATFQAVIVANSATSFELKDLSNPDLFSNAFIPRASSLEVCNTAVQFALQRNAPSAPSTQPSHTLTQ